jgi:hypothetical protein
MQRSERRAPIATALAAALVSLFAVELGCSAKAPEAVADVVSASDAPPEPPPPPPHPTTEDGILQAFTQATERKDLEAMKRVLSPELGAELANLHKQSPEEFWARGSEWVKNAQSGLSIATRADDAATATRWRALVRFGNGVEETVEFTRVDGKLLLADL